MPGWYSFPAARQSAAFATLHTWGNAKRNYFAIVSTQSMLSSMLSLFQLTLLSAGFQADLLFKRLFFRFFLNGIAKWCTMYKTELQKLLNQIQQTTWRSVHRIASYQAPLKFGWCVKAVAKKIYITVPSKNSGEHICRSA